MYFSHFKRAIVIFIPTQGNANNATRLKHFRRGQSCSLSLFSALSTRPTPHALLDHHGLSPPSLHPCCILSPSAYPRLHTLIKPQFTHNSVSTVPGKGESVLHFQRQTGRSRQNAWSGLPVEGRPRGRKKQALSCNFFLAVFFVFFRRGKGLHTPSSRGTDRSSPRRKRSASSSSRFSCDEVVCAAPASEGFRCRSREQQASSGS